MTNNTDDNESLELSREDCPICNFKETEELEEELAKGLPKTVVADDLDCDVEKIEYHMEQHFTTIEDFGDEELDTANLDYMITYQERESYEKFDILEQNMRRLTDRFDNIMQKGGDLDKDDTDQIVKMAREIRQTATSIADLEQEIRQELKLNERQFQELKAAILRELDKEDQMRILSLLQKEVEE